MTDNQYIRVINQAIDYIHRNLDKNLTAEDIADYCCFSRYYFSRMFRSVVGESVYSFIKRRKLESAALLLKTRRLSITEIALQHGYSSSNFASAFKEYFGINAAAYRRNKDFTPRESLSSIIGHIQSLKKREDAFDIVNSKIEIRKIERMNLLYERFIGNYQDLATIWDDFCRKAEERQLINEKTHFIGVSYDNPLITDENRCIYDVCINVENLVGNSIHKIDEGYYACYRFHDSLSNLGKSYNEIFTFWMPYCEYPIDNRLPLEVYHAPMDEEGRMLLDICIPIVK